jgi:low temperature requirement protein LtrA
LLLKYHLPVLVTEVDQIAVVVEIDELLACTTGLLAGEIRELVVAVEMDFERLAPSLVAGDLRDGRHSGRHLRLHPPR